MKLVFTSYTSSPSFTEPRSWLKRIEGYTGILEQLAKDHEVISIERINYEGELVQGGVRYQFAKEDRKMVRFPRRLHRLVREAQPDVVFINGIIFPLQVIQLRLAIGKAPKIILMHRSELPPKGRRRKLMQQMADRWVDAYLFSTAALGEEWSGIISGNKIHEVVLGSSIFQCGEKVVARERLQITGSPVFIWVGALTPGKDPLLVISAFMEWSREHPAARLYMIYHEEKLLRDVQALLKNYGEQAESVVLVGEIAHDQLQDWYNSADFFIAGSKHEGLGVAQIEAMSCGCIPITTNIKASTKLLGDSCGFTYEVGNRDSLMEVLQKCPGINMEAERQKVLEQYRRYLSFEVSGRKINEVINNLNTK